MSTSSQGPDGSTGEVVDWTDLGQQMWSFLTGREAAINYRFIDMTVEIPRDTGSDAPRATWKLDGTLQITTDDNTTDDNTTDDNTTDDNTTDDNASGAGRTQRGG